MPRTCTLCRHQQRRGIDEALIGGMAFRDIARQFATTKDAVARHKAHVPATLVRAHRAREVARADTLLARIETLYAKVEQVLARAETERTHRGDMRVLAAIREGRETAELLAKMAGELSGDGTTVNILVNPQWVTLQATILRALDPYPQAREAVSRALVSLEGGARGDARRG